MDSLDLYSNIENVDVILNITSNDNTIENENRAKNSNSTNTTEDAQKSDSGLCSSITDDCEVDFKERIEQCKNIIDSLKSELTDEKNRNNKEIEIPSSKNHTVNYDETDFMSSPDYTKHLDDYSVTIVNRLQCDENLLKYEQQLEKYQNTLNMAQIEKKNAIRKQMLAKAYKLKLLEVENQCNIELLRVKQSLQCLQPLEIILKKMSNSHNADLFTNDNLVPELTMSNNDNNTLIDSENDW